jgi:hypothetical protein
MNEDDRKATVQMFVSILGATEREASAVVAAGHTSIEEVAYVPLEELHEVQGIEKVRINAFRERALKHLRLASK